jgi:DNA ligase D-like protein (predicted 3'-phosphoesterase)
MVLERYNKIREFNKTGEPEGKVKLHRTNIYVIQKHNASHLHYDLRLEMDGILKSWAIPKQPPEKQGVKRLAIQTEDHPVDYASFEGIIPKGLYGAGAVEIWDRGTYTLEEKEEEKIIIVINGKRLNGRYCLIRFKDEEKNWLFFKC